MSQTICAGCDRPFTHAGYSRHLSMTTRPRCRALYHSRLDCATALNPPGISGPEDGGPRGGSGPENGDSSAYFCWLDHASKLTCHSRRQ